MNPGPFYAVGLSFHGLNILCGILILLPNWIPRSPYSFPLWLSYVSGIFLTTASTLNFAGGLTFNIFVYTCGNVLWLSNVVVVIWMYGYYVRTLVRSAVTLGDLSFGLNTTNWLRRMHKWLFFFIGIMTMVEVLLAIIIIFECPFIPLVLMHCAFLVLSLVLFTTHVEASFQIRNWLSDHRKQQLQINKTAKQQLRVMHEQEIERKKELRLNRRSEFYRTYGHKEVFSVKFLKDLQQTRLEEIDKSNNQNIEMTTRRLEGDANRLTGCHQSMISRPPTDATDAARSFSRPPTDSIQTLRSTTDVPTTPKDHKLATRNLIEVPRRTAVDSSPNALTREPSTDQKVHMRPLAEVGSSIIIKRTQSDISTTSRPNRPTDVRARSDSTMEKRTTSDISFNVHRLKNETNYSKPSRSKPPHQDTKTRTMTSSDATGDHTPVSLLSFSDIVKRLKSKYVALLAAVLCSFLAVFVGIIRILRAKSKSWREFSTQALEGSDAEIVFTEIAYKMMLSFVYFLLHFVAWTKNDLKANSVPRR